MNNYLLFQKARLTKVRLISTDCKVVDIDHPLNTLKAQITHQVSFIPSDSEDHFGIGLETSITAADKDDDHEVVLMDFRLLATYQRTDKTIKTAEFEKAIELFIHQLFLTNRTHIVDLMGQMGLTSDFMPYTTLSAAIVGSPSDKKKK